MAPELTISSSLLQGLDMKRREYSALSKNVSSYVLEQILSGESTENVVSSIHSYLGDIGEAVRTGTIPLEDFIIFKRLGKDPKAYGANINGQPHVHVALRMQERGLGARMGDVIPYIFCLGQDGSSSSKSAQADRAHHPDELRKQGSELKVDYEHYLALQILPPVERLCESIQGTDRGRLAECLGLDASRYASTSAAANALPDREFVTLDSQTPDSVRFAKCERLSLACPRCRSASTFEGVTALSPKGLVCTSEDCNAPLPLASAAIQLELSIRAHISRYYTAWQACNEPSCGVRTRLVGVYASRCLVRGCKGRVAPEYSDKQLYDQLCYYASLFDVTRAASEEAKIVAARHREQLEALGRTVSRYLERNDRRFVDLSKLFGRRRA